MSVKATKWVRELSAEGLTTSDIAVLYILADHHNASSDKCYPSRRTIKSIARMSENTVTKVVQKLERIGLIKRIARTEKSGRQTSNQYRLDMGWTPPNSGGEGIPASPPNSGGGTPPSPLPPSKGEIEITPPMPPSPVFENFWNPLSRPGDRYEQTKRLFLSLPESDRQRAVRGAKIAALMVRKKQVRRRAPYKLLELRFWQHPDYLPHIEAAQRYEAMIPIARYSRIWWSVFWARILDRKPVGLMVEKASKSKTDPYRVDPAEVPPGEFQESLVRTRDLNRIAEFRSALRNIGDERRIPYSLPDLGSDGSYFLPGVDCNAFCRSIRQRH
jgi:hypothetical protein